MPATVKANAVSSHRVIGETRPAMLKASLPSGENRSFLEEIGACLDFARRTLGWTVDQLAAELGRDSKQVARWMRGEERTQVDVVFGVPKLRGPFVIALAQLAECDVVTTISVRRTA
jgi:ribosome-binding protein aMBF1 (putative translation factor)